MSLNLTPSQMCPKPYPQEPIRRRNAKLERLMLLLIAALLLAAAFGVLVLNPIHSY